MCDKKTSSIVHAEQVAVERVAELMTAAETELAAYYDAVFRRYGLKEARKAAQDWIEELERSDWEKWKSAPRHIAGSLPSWRDVTISAARRLATRVVHGPTGR